MNDDDWIKEQLGIHVDEENLCEKTQAERCARLWLALLDSRLNGAFGPSTCKIEKPSKVESKSGKFQREARKRESIADREWLTSRDAKWVVEDLLGMDWCDWLKRVNQFEEAWKNGSPYTSSADNYAP